MFYLCVSPKLIKMTRQEVVGLIYQSSLCRAVFLMQLIQKRLDYLEVVFQLIPNLNSALNRFDRIL